MRAARVVLLVLMCLGVPGGATAIDAPPDATTPQPFEQWLADLHAEARVRGYSEELLARTLATIQPIARVLERDRAQPESRLTFDEYVRARVTPAVVRRGRELMRLHRDVLARVRDAYGVPPAIVVAIWGLESRFGEGSGDIPVLAALATLAWEGRRGAFFRGQLYDALTIVERGDADADRLHGSWAGAMGQPQFMPSSYLAYAVDFDGDGRRDIWRSVDDTFASIANYLQSHGWRGDDWGREVRVPAAARRAVAADAESRSGCRAMREMSASRSLAEWRRLGVVRAGNRPLTSASRPARLVRLGHRDFLVDESYEALLRYNCAHLYALTAGLLADRLR